MTLKAYLLLNIPLSQEQAPWIFTPNLENSKSTRQKGDACLLHCPQLLPFSRAAAKLWCLKTYWLNLRHMLTLTSVIRKGESTWKVILQLSGQSKPLCLEGHQLG